MTDKRDYAGGAMRLYKDPVVTVISRPMYCPPEHIKWRSDAGNDPEELVEFGGRLCYLSFGKDVIDGHKSIQGRTTNEEYIQNILHTAHGSVIEHANWSMLFEGVSRSLTHELVRHRHFSYSQLSQRYVDESDVAYVVPPELQKPENKAAYDVWLVSCMDATASYRAVTDLLSTGQTTTIDKKKLRQTARAVLPNCTETKIVVTGNTRAWRFFMQKRGHPSADTEIRKLAVEVWRNLKGESRHLFGDIELVGDSLQLKYENV